MSKRLIEFFRIARSFFSSLFLNLHYLPFNQAIHLPILLYKPRFLNMRGSIVISAEMPVSFGMIRMGFPFVSIFPNNGIVWDNTGGNVSFMGSCIIGSNSAISVSNHSNLRIGDGFVASTSLKLVCYYNVVFNDNVRLGWDCIVMDTDFHKLTKIEGGYNRGYGAINIGANNWFGNSCKIMKRTSTPDFCTISAGTILSGPVNAPKYSIIGEIREVGVIASGYFRNPEDDIINY